MEFIKYDQGNPIMINNSEDIQKQTDQRICFSGETEYPVHVTYVDLNRSYMNRIGWNWHPEIEVFLVEEGSAIIYYDDSQISLEVGQGVIINQNVMHSILSVSPSQSCKLFSYAFHPSFLFGYGDTLFTSKYVTPLLHHAGLRVLHLDSSDEGLSHILSLSYRIVQLNKDQEWGYELATKACICELWCELLRKFPFTPEKTRHTAVLTSDELRTREIMKYIEIHYAERITLDDLAAQVHISKSECCRCVKRCLHMTPVEYLMKYRIYMAAYLIQKNDPAVSSISDLAFQVGFNNASYFNKVFRQYLQCTPGEFRKKIRQNPDFQPFHADFFPKNLS